MLKKERSNQKKNLVKTKALALDEAAFALALLKCKELILAHKITFRLVRYYCLFDSYVDIALERFIFIIKKENSAANIQAAERAAKKAVKKAAKQAVQLMHAKNRVKNYGFNPPTL